MFTSRFTRSFTLVRYKEVSYVQHAVKAGPGNRARQACLREEREGRRGFLEERGPHRRKNELQMLLLI